MNRTESGGGEADARTPGLSDTVLGPCRPAGVLGRGPCRVLGPCRGLGRGPCTSPRTSHPSAPRSGQY